MTENSIKLSVFKHGKTSSELEIRSIRLPGYNGDLGILPNRAPIMGVLTAGVIRVEDMTGTCRIYATTGGFYELQNNRLMLICDDLFSASNLTVDDKKGIFYRQDTSTMNDDEKRQYVIALLKSEISKQNSKQG